MRAFLARLLVRVHLLAPFAAHAEGVKDPLNYPMKQWILIVGLAFFGGLASWWTKVRRGEVAFHNLQALIGELTVAIFAGTVTFFGCEYMNAAPLLTAALVSIAGHMGVKAIALLERAAARRITKALLNTAPAPLDTKE